jgi:hypothetical protein
MTSALVNVIHAALEGAGAEIVESATPVLFRLGLEYMWQDIARLDEVIAQNKKERAS